MVWHTFSELLHDVVVELYTVDGGGEAVGLTHLLQLLVKVDQVLVTQVWRQYLAVKRLCKQLSKVKVSSHIIITMIFYFQPQQFKKYTIPFYKYNIFNI